MKRSGLLTVFVVLVAGAFSSLAAGPVAAAPSTYIKAYANILGGTQYALTPEEVQTTSDGGAVALALTQSSKGIGVNWLVKLDARGNPQWQTELGCLSGAPGDYAFGVSIHQTSDGGYILGGGTIDCGSRHSCPALSGQECALVEKLDSAGRLQWSFAFKAGAAGSAITRITQTTDGGYIAVGSATNSSQNTGALILKLSGAGSVQWQRQLGPAGSISAILNAVQQTSDGGYIATGEFYVPRSGLPFTSVLAVRLDSSGNIRWQRGFNDLSRSGSPNAVEHAESILQTPDGGYLVAGNWGNGTSPGQCCSGALLLKLDSNGSIQWQKAYSGGVYCYFNGFGETCTDIGAVINSLHRTADGSYLLAGDGQLELNDSVSLEPWFAKVDSSGNLLWQHFYYRVNQVSQRPFSGYFSSSTLTGDGSPLALGFVESASSGRGELFGVKTDREGVVASCSEVQSATALNPIDPGLQALAPSLPVQATATAPNSSPSATSTTSVAVHADC